MPINAILIMKNAKQMPKNANKIKIWLRNFLIKYYNYPEAEYIDEWLKTSKIGLIVFLLDLVINGSILVMALFPLYTILTYFTQYRVPLYYIPVFIISFGLLAFIVSQAYEGITSGRSRVASSYKVPKR